MFLSGCNALPIFFNRASSLGPILSAMVTVMSLEICERDVESNLCAVAEEDWLEEYYEREKRNSRRPEEGNEQSERALLKCQRCVRSSSDA